MSHRKSSRRTFLQKTAGGVACGIAAPYIFTASGLASEKSRLKNDRLHVGVIGVGGRGSAVAREAAQFGDVVAVCDVNRQHAERMKQALGNSKADLYQDYRKLLERKDIDVITNGTPDHWHTLINVAACRAGKDVYTEKPLTLTIAEGKLLRKVVEQTGRVLQVGTQLRSDKAYGHYPLAVEIVRNGRLGKLQEVQVLLPFRSTRGGPFAVKPAPAWLDWDLWQGQAPSHDYCPERVDPFRWWSEYAGGMVTDWGAHDIDIAHWGMDMEHSGPLTVEATANVPNGGRPNCFDNPDTFKAVMMYPGGLKLTLESYEGARQGVTFVGEKGRLHVNRGAAHGKPFERLKEQPLPENGWKAPRAPSHMANFFDCVKSRQTPAASVETGHRNATVCHLANIAMRLKRKLTWDAKTEQIVGDEEANAWQSRTQRKGFEIV